MSNVNFVPPFAFGSRSVESSQDSDERISSLKELERGTDRTSEAVKLEMVAAGHSIPHLEKMDKQGEDAFFISAARNGVMGLADGVGSWSKDGIDPSMYSKGLMKEAKRAVEIKSHSLPLLYITLVSRQVVQCKGVHDDCTE